MSDGLFPWSHFMVSLSMVRLFLEFSNFKAFGPLYTMDHEVGPCKMVFSHGPT